MEFLRTSKNQWGQQVLEGVSWDLLGIFFGVTFVVIICHALFMWLMTRSPDKSAADK